jgi:A/G-specific adenine glycosylase
LPIGKAGDWNQALMDLGSSICLSANPKCLLCPLRLGCRSAGGLPGRLRKKRQPEYRESSRYYRGRLLWQLRSLPPGTTESLADIAGNLAAHGVAEPPSGWLSIGEGLVRDGLARMAETEDGVRVGLA